MHGLPAELRSYIYELAVTEATYIDTEDRYEARRPAITQVCRQARSEALPLYFKNNIFVLFIRNKRYLQAFQWLKLLGAADVRDIKNLTIVCYGGLLNPVPMPFTRGSEPLLKPSFMEWDYLISRLAELGFRAQQLKWPPFFWRNGGDRPSDQDDEFFFEEPFEHEALCEMYLFETYLLPPLLECHGLFDSDCPPKTILHHMLELGYFNETAEDAHTLDSSAVTYAEAPELWWKEYVDWLRRLGKAMPVRQHT